MSKKSSGPWNSASSGLVRQLNLLYKPFANVHLPDFVSFSAVQTTISYSVLVSGSVIVEMIWVTKWKMRFSLSFNVWIFLCLSRGLIDRFLVLDPIMKLLVLLII